MRFLFLVVIGWLYAGLAAGQAPALVKTQRTEFVIRAVDDKTSAELPTQFRITARRAKKKWEGTSKPPSGFMFILTRTDTLTVIAKSPGYLEAEEVMVVTCDTCPDYAYTILLEKYTRPDSVFSNLRVKQAFRLDNIYFDQGSYILRPESYPQLDKLVKTLATTPKLVIEIVGHTDNVGDRRLNQALSENRVKVIRSYLIRSGIAEDRLRINGYGDARPAAPNDSEENKRKNRRVEFVVLAL